MMNSELMKFVQEQMSRIFHDELAKLLQEMLSNPDFVRFVTEDMENLEPEDLKTRIKDMVEMAVMRALDDAQLSYELNAAEMLKKQGNDLHKRRKYSEAAQKYFLAKNNLKGVPISKGRTLQLACSLNLMSCYLNLRKFEDCIKEGSEVLAYDSENIKALYRRGQACKEMGKFQDAISDLSKASAIRPHDKTIMEVLRETEELFAKECDVNQRVGVCQTPACQLKKKKKKKKKKNVMANTGHEDLSLKGIVEEDTDPTPTNCHQDFATTEFSVTKPQEAGERSRAPDVLFVGAPDINGSSIEAESLQSLKDSPEVPRSFHNFISNANPDSPADLSGGEMSPDMIKTMSDMVGPEELLEMIGIASYLNGKNPLFSTTTPDANSQRSRIVSQSSGSVPTANENHEVRENSSQGLFTNPRTSPFPSTIPSSTTDVQEQIRNQMRDPDMMQMFSSMVENMSSDMMANMSQQFGLELSPEEAAEAQQAMSSLLPNDLERMMHWIEKLQRAAEGARKMKNWILGTPGMILSICMLLLAMVLRWMGYVGRMILAIFMLLLAMALCWMGYVGR